MAKQVGLEWVEGTFGFEPRWTSEPKIEIVELIARQNLALSSDSPCRVGFHAQGAFNKLYKVETQNGCFLMRVSLPVDPSHKTKSEVATIEFIREHTDIPLPRILAFDSTHENILGFEWILMEMMPGKQLRSKWRTLPFSTKRQLVQQIAKYQSQLFRNKFVGIGNLFPRQEGQELSRALLESGSATISPAAFDGGKQDQVLGRIVSLIFFWGDHINQDVPRGPFVKRFVLPEQMF